MATLGGSFGKTAPLRKHKGKQRPKYVVPGAGSYNHIDTASFKFKKVGGSSFGGKMAKMDRGATGYLSAAHKFRAPGPGAYNSKSGIAGQVSSLRPSSSNFKFGTSGRDDFHKSYVPELVQEGSSRKTPGPGSYSSTTHDNIARKKGKSKAPVYSFGGNLAKVKRGGPGARSETLPQCGPGSYETKESVGKQANSLKKTAAKCNFGTADRSKSEVTVQPGYAGKSKGVADNPGPGSYEHTSSVGRQANAKKQSSYRFSFGNETRDKRVALESRDIQRTPGPGAYTSAPALGQQTNSKFETTSRTLFGTSERPDLGNEQF